MSSHAAVVLCAAALVAGTVYAQAPEPPQGGQPPAGAPPHPRTFPKPTNLKVLPKDLTGEQVMDIMHKWEGQLGAECTTCHAADPTRKMPNGRPALNFADDSKKEKQAARLMFKMTEDINTNYVSMVDNSGTPVSCGTCHRGHITPEPFVPKPEEHEHEHHDQPAGQKPPAH